jgi:alpha-L-rhamnosidase
MKAPGNSIEPVHLRCEYLNDPIGIDMQNPCLSWRLVGSGRGARQTAYRILASGSPGGLDRDSGDRWDSGKVVSDTTIHVTYGGSALRSGERLFWKVRVWDEADRPSAWSATAFFETGMLAKDDWKAKWIGAKGGGSQRGVVFGD